MQGNKGTEGSLSVDQRNQYSARCTWTIPVKGKMKQKAIWSKYFDVGGYDCRLLLYPGGDSQALPGYISVYLQITDPASALGSGKWECFTSYRLCIENQVSPEKSVSRDSWHRFSPKKKSHGWCDFTPSTTILDVRKGFCVNDTIVVAADILLLKEEYSFQRDAEPNPALPLHTTANSDVLAGKFTWRVHNISMFMEVMSMQKIMSPVFPAGDCSLRLSVYQSVVNDTEYLSMCLESKDAEKGSNLDKSCWCLFRMSVQSHKEKNGQHMLRDSYGRIAADARTGDSTSLGWNDFMHMSDFLDAEQSYVSADGTAVFSASFHIIKEHTNFVRSIDRPPRRPKQSMVGETFQGKFTWKIENFTKLKDLLKKRKITSLCIKSRRFQVGGKDCRLIVYPRGQSQPPMHLSMFLEVTDPRNQDTDWSCFVSHRLSVINQQKDKDADKSVCKESQNRYSKAAKDWGWREFVTLTSLFDTDLGFLLNDTIVLCAEVLILKESCDVQLVPLAHDSSRVPQLQHSAQSMDAAVACSCIPPGKKLTFTWKIDNFLSFKEILETRKIFSKFFTIGSCELRIGVYESFDTLCIYLESESQTHTHPQDNSFWVQYRIAAVSQRQPQLTEWKESSICTRTWNNSVLQFIKVPDMLNSEKGFLVKDSIVLVCDILECTPWLEFGDTDLTLSEPDTTDPPTCAPRASWTLDGEDTVTDKQDFLKRLLGMAGLQLSRLVSTEAPVGSTMVSTALKVQAMLQDKLSEDMDVLQTFFGEIRAWLQDASKLQWLTRTNMFGVTDTVCSEAAPSLLELLLSVPALRQPLLDLLIGLLLSTCEQYTEQCAAAAASRPPQDVSGLGAGPHSAGLAHPANGAGAGGGLQGHWTSPCAHGNAPGEAGVAGAASAFGGAEAAARSSRWSPAALFALVQPRRFMSSYLELAPLMVARAVGTSPVMEQLRELVALIMSITAGADAWKLHEARVSNAVDVPEPTVDHMHRILSLAPRELVPYIIMMVPVVVDPYQHTMAAGRLLAVLADAAQQGPEAEAEIQLPVCYALSMLRMEVTFATSMLQQTLSTLPKLPGNELPGAIMLIMKLTSDAPKLARPAMAAVRSAVAAQGPNVSLGLLQILCLSIRLHEDAAAALLEDVRERGDGRETQAVPASASEEAQPAPSTAGSSSTAADGRVLEGAGGPNRSWVMEIELLLELMQLPQLCRDAELAFENAVRQGLITCEDTALLLERRRMQQIMFRTLVSQLPGAAMRDACNSRLPPHALPAGPAGEQAGADAAAADAFRTFMGPSLMDSDMAPADADVESICKDDFDILLSLAQALSRSVSAAVQQFTFRLYLHIFALWPGQEGRVRMIHMLVHRGMQFASNTTTPDASQGLVPLPAGCMESRVLLCIVDEWPQFASVALLCLLDVVGKTTAAASLLTMKHRMAVEDLKRTQDALSTASSTLADERQSSKAAVASLESTVRTQAADAAQEKAELQDEAADLQEQVAKLHAELRGAKQAAQAAQSKAVDAQRDARHMESSCAALDEEAKKLRSVVAQHNKRQQKDTQRLKELENRLSTADGRVAERDSQIDALNKQVAKVTHEQRTAAAQVETERKTVKTKESELAAANTRITELEELSRTQEAELAKLREDHAQQRIILPPGMEEDFDVHENETAAPASSMSDSTGETSAPSYMQSFKSRGPSGIMMPLFTGSFPPMHGGSGVRLTGEGESLLNPPQPPPDSGGTAMAQGALGARRPDGVRATSATVGGINPAAKPFVASSMNKGRGGGAGAAGGTVPLGGGLGQPPGGFRGPKVGALKKDGMDAAMHVGMGAPMAGLSAGAGTRPIGYMPQPPLTSLGRFGFFESAPSADVQAAHPVGSSALNLPSDSALLRDSDRMHNPLQASMPSQGSLMMPGSQAPASSAMSGSSSVPFTPPPQGQGGTQSIWSL